MGLSAVCAYNLSTAEAVFARGKYMQSATVEQSHTKWVRYSGPVPSPRPGAVSEGLAAGTWGGGCHAGPDLAAHPRALRGLSVSPQGAGIPLGLGRAAGTLSSSCVPILSMCVPAVAAQTGVPPAAGVFREGTVHDVVRSVSLSISCRETISWQRDEVHSPLINMNHTLSLKSGAFYVETNL